MKRHFDHRRAGAAIVLALLALPIQQPAGAEDWPFVRGDTHGTGVAKTELPDALDVLWKYHSGKDAGFDATPVVAGGVIFIGDSKGTFHAVSLANRNKVWSKEFANTSFTSGAAIEGDHLYVGDMDGVVRCLAVSDGQEKWSRKLNAEIYAGPTPYQGNLLVTAESGTLSCLSSADGRDVWAPFKIDAPLRCTPTVAAGRVMLAGCDALLHVIDAATGKQIQTVKIDGPTGSTPAMHNDRIFFGTESGTFFAIDVPAAAEKQPAVAWTFHDLRRAQPIRSAAAVNDELVVFGSQGKAIFGLNPQTGKPKWTVPTRSRVESSPVLAGRRVVVATSTGKLYLLDVASGEVKWEYDAGGGFVGSPVVVDGRLIIGNTDGTLYCFGSKKKIVKPTTKDTNNTKESEEKKQ